MKNVRSGSPSRHGSEKENPAEWERLLAIYEKYPLEELIVHPRGADRFYKNRVNLEAFALAEKNSRHSLCYNGDIVDAASAAHIREGFPSVDKFMIGRGLIKRPWLGGTFRRQTGKAGAKRAVFPVSQCDPGGIPAADVRGQKYLI